MATAVCILPDFTMYSAWTVSGGRITAGPYRAQKNELFTITGIPDNAEIESAEVTAYFGQIAYGAKVLRMNGQLIDIGQQTVSVTPTHTGNGEYEILFEFQSNGNASLPNGNHGVTMAVTAPTLTVTYTPYAPDPDPEPEVEWNGPKPISVFAPGAEKFNNNGLAVLFPTQGRMKAVAGGACEITMTHPIDDDGKWRYLVPENIIRIPVPAETIENAFIGRDVDLYRTITGAALREGPKEPRTINYSMFDAATYPKYAVGARVTYIKKNYELIKEYTTVYAPTPDNYPDYWKEIVRTEPGAPVLVQLAVGQDLYFIEDNGDGWYLMSTPMGLEGYIKSNQITFIRHISPEEQDERIITDQLFRIKEATIDTENMEVNVYAQHVSYDLANIIMRDVTGNQASPALIISKVMDGLMRPYRGQIATNLTTDENGTFTGSFNGKNGIFAFLDPDSGIVNTFKARFTRDNWDMFILKMAHTDRGLRIRYGKNARGISWKRSTDNLVTCVVPVAKDKEGKDYYLPEDWVESPKINDYAEVYMQRLAVKGQIGKDDGNDGTWTAETLADEMRAKATERFTVDHADDLYVEITVNFEQLGDTVEHSWLKDLEHVLLYDLVTAEDVRVGLESALTVSEIEWDYIRRKITAVKLSSNTDYGLKTVAGYNIDNNSIGTEKLTDAAISEIANLLN